MTDIASTIRMLPILRKTSSIRLFGLPLYDIAFHATTGAVGIVAIGRVATGVIAIGVIARGFLAVGVVSLGLVSVGAVSLGALAVGAVSIGGASVGVVSTDYRAVYVNADRSNPIMRRQKR